jgi:hypothetical protein
MDKVGLFVSYNHQDSFIADTLVEALAFASTALDIFIDHSGLEGGDDYEDKIHESILKSQWFLIICPQSIGTRRDMSYCFYEAGQFRARLQSQNIAEIRKRICCLYDGQIPGPLSKYEGTKVSAISRGGRPINLSSEDSLDLENTELFSLVETIIKRSGATNLVDLGDEATRKALRSGVKRIISAFIAAGINDSIDEVVFQPRISFIVSPSGDSPSNGLAPETEIDGEATTTLANIFGITGRFSTWKHIKENALSIYKMEPVWIADLEQAVLNLANNNVPIQPVTLCLGRDGNFYAPIVTRYELFRSGKKKCYIVFIPSQSRNFASTMRSSILLTGLILSVRFGQRVLPTAAELKAIQPGDAGANRRMDILCKLLQELVAIENEAIEFGLPVVRDEHDEPPLLDAFRDGSTKEELRREILKWTVIRNTFIEKVAEARSPDKPISATDAANYVIESFADMKKLNSRFLIDICGELLYVLGVETDTANDAPKTASGRQ